MAEYDTPGVLEAGFAEIRSRMRPRWYQLPVYPESDREMIIDKVQRLTGLEVELDRQCEPVVSDENSPELQKLERAIRKYFPEQPGGFVRMNGATDARHMLPMGVPIAITSAVGEGCHSRCEWVELASIDKYIGVLEEVIANI